MSRKTRSPEYQAWSQAKRRGPIDPRWQSFDNFLADMGERQEGCRFHRDDPRLPYGPSNCQWIPKSAQNSRTTRTVWLTLEGISRPLTDWCGIHGVSPRVAQYRHRRAWTDYEVIHGRQFQRTEQFVTDKPGPRQLFDRSGLSGDPEVRGGAFSAATRVLHGQWDLVDDTPTTAYYLWLLADCGPTREKAIRDFRMLRYRLTKDYLYRSWQSGGPLGDPQMVWLVLNEPILLSTSWILGSGGFNPEPRTVPKLSLATLQRRCPWWKCWDPAEYAKYQKRRKGETTARPPWMLKK